MKRILSILLVSAAFQVARAQCDKVVIWTGSKTEFLDSTGKLQKTEQGQVIIETAPGRIKVTYKTGDGESETIEGDIRNLVCKWKDAFKEGKMEFKSLLAKPNGETKEAYVQLEASDGRVIALFALENANGMRMRIPVDNVREK